MKRAFRLGVPVTVLAAAAAGVLLWTAPWDSGTGVQEAAAGTIEHRLCNVVLEAPLLPPPPARDIIAVAARLERRGGDLTKAADLKPVLEVKLIVPAPDPVTGIEPDPSWVSIDPWKGTIKQEQYSAAAHEGKLAAVLNTVRVEPLDPATAPWPYTDAVQTPARRHTWSAFDYRWPDPGSGIVVSGSYADGDDSFAHTLKVASCRSLTLITAIYRSGTEPELSVVKDIHPEDEAAFKTFLDQVTLNGESLAP